MLIERHIAGESAATIHILPTDPALFCTYCSYFIRLTSEKDENEFHGHVTVLLDDDVIWLQESRPLIDNLDAREQAIYRLSVPPKEYIYLSLIAFSGTPEVYVNYHFDTNASNYELGPYKRRAELSSINFRIAPRE